MCNGTNVDWIWPDVMEDDHLNGRLLLWSRQNRSAMRLMRQGIDTSLSRPHGVMALGHQCDCHQTGEILWAATGHSLVVVKRPKRKQASGKETGNPKTGAQLGGSGAVGSSGSQW
ncbi:hypothetical protein GE21DRAFT_1307916 [Neurospora crassa]|nr:hypothetical protein B15I20.130 [imported] - Neurospora crassa [Neurospora crassa]KHE85301.1 hypothetical protein GE21DRAFT_1307916 [Neurospora crassa]